MKQRVFVARPQRPEFDDLYLVIKQITESLGAPVLRPDELTLTDVSITTKNQFYFGKKCKIHYLMVVWQSNARLTLGSQKVPPIMSLQRTSKPLRGFAAAEL
jgi:hypothetical protein